MEDVTPFAGRILNEFSDLSKCTPEGDEVIDSVTSLGLSTAGSAMDTDDHGRDNEAGGFHTVGSDGEPPTYTEEFLSDTESQGSVRGPHSASVHGRRRVRQGGRLVSSSRKLSDEVPDPVANPRGVGRRGGRARKQSSPSRRPEQVSSLPVCDSETPSSISNPPSPSSDNSNKRKREEGGGGRSNDSSDPVNSHAGDDKVESEQSSIASPPAKKVRASSSKPSRKENSIQFIKGYVKSKKPNEKPKALSLEKVEELLEEGPSNPKATSELSMAFLLPLMMFLQKNIIVVSHVSRAPGERRATVKTSEGKAYFDSLYKRASPEDKATLDKVKERYSSEYWKIPFGDYDKVSKIVLSGLDCQVILNSVERSSFADKRNPSVLIECLVPTFRYEPILKK